MDLVTKRFMHAVKQASPLLLAFALGTGHADASTPKPETIDATAQGTSTTLGEMVGVTLDIYDYSTPADTSILIQAFQKDKDHGLVNALSKMKAVGHVAITGTIGYDVSYIHVSATPTGRKIFFVTNRPLRFGETYFDTRSQSYNLSVGELDLNDTDRSKSTGFLYPESKLTVNQQGQLQYDLIGNPMKLTDILDWKGTPGVN